MHDHAAQVFRRVLHHGAGQGHWRDGPGQGHGDELSRKIEIEVGDVHVSHAQSAVASQKLMSTGTKITRPNAAASTPTIT